MLAFIFIFIEYAGELHIVALFEYILKKTKYIGRLLPPASTHMYTNKQLRHANCCEVLVDCPPLPKSLSFWVHLVGA